MDVKTFNIIKQLLPYKKNSGLEYGAEFTEEIKGNDRWYYYKGYDGINKEYIQILTDSYTGITYKLKGNKRKVKKTIGISYA